MADRTIEYKVIIDTTTGQSSITDLNGNLVETDKLIKDIGKSTQENTQGRIASIRDMTVAFNGVKQAVDMVIGALSGMVKASEEARANENQLNLALKNTGNASAETAESIKKMAASMQSAGIAEGDAVVKTAALGLQMGITAENIKGATQAAYGLAKAYGVDADSAIKLVSSGLQGNFEQLGRLNPEIRNAGSEAEKASIFQKMLGDSYAFARSEGEQFSGTMQRIKNDFGDIQEELGATIIGLGGVAKYIDLTASFEYVKAGLASLVNAFVISAEGFTMPFIIMWDYAKMVFAGLKTAFTELISGNFSAALGAMKNIAVEGTNIVKREINEQIALAGQYSAIWEQANQNIATKKAEQAAKDLENIKLQNQAKSEEDAKLAQKALEDQKKLDDELFQERQASDNAETERQKSEQEKRIAANQEFLAKKYADEETAQTEADIKSIENEYTTSEQIKAIKTSEVESENEGLQLRIMQVDNAANQMIEKWQEMKDKGIVSESQYAQAVVSITQTAENQKNKIREESYKTAGMNALKNLQSLKSLGSDGAKIAKTAAIAETTINTYSGATAAYKSLAGIPFIGPGLGIAAAIAAIAAGMANVAAITSTSTGFQSGGYTGDVPENQAAGTVHGREFVLNAEATKRIGVTTLNAIQAGVPVSVLPFQSFAGSATTAALNGVSGSVQAMNMNMVNGASAPTPIIEINANTDLINFEIKRREASNEVDRTNYKADNV